jgi:hypothetical protein
MVVTAPSNAGRVALGADVVGVNVPGGGVSAHKAQGQLHVAELDRPGAARRVGVEAVFHGGGGDAVVREKLADLGERLAVAGMPAATVDEQRGGPRGAAAVGRAQGDELGRIGPVLKLLLRGAGRGARSKADQQKEYGGGAGIAHCHTIQRFPVAARE